MNAKKPETRLATHTNEELYYRDDALVTELMGQVTFTEMMFMCLTSAPMEQISVIA